MSEQDVVPGVTPEVTDEDRKAFREAVEMVERMAFCDPPRQNAAIRVTDDRVLIKPDRSAESLSKGGIIMPMTAKQERCTRGTILATGPGRRARVLVGVSRVGEVVYELSDRRIPCELKVGDRVLVVEGRALVTQHKGEECWIVSEPNVLAVEEA